MATACAAAWGISSFSGFFETFGSSCFSMANSFVSPQVLFDLGVNADAAEATDEAADAIFST
jgi:hypothetical protein